MIDFVNAYSEPYFEFVGVDCSAKLVKELHTSSLRLQSRRNYFRILTVGFLAYEFETAVALYSRSDQRCVVGASTVPFSFDYGRHRQDIEAEAGGENG